ncbi:helix-turn-helix transcriptional regulator [Jannaschia sp. Os4]|uniref:helix-turn-helix transcriptional regulator n=1 Tax=Jannaschia sp. Os4 TaxID=2807617 RepID=UPI00193AAE42|nr:helix-turn-helix transcriptional regulator [Jannaschia sp. Os4]MBM2577579.1 helix-turn-helix transcriptional regulator [Jannaschia sp. Os4]
MARRSLILGIALFQLIAVLVFVGDIALQAFGSPFGPIPWAAHEAIEIAAASALLAGVALGGVALHTSLRRADAAETALRHARAAFQDVLEERFSAWGLTPAERDVALFAIKGMSGPEIADLRGTSEGTIKAQMAAIYRKAGVHGRPQLLSLFIEEILGDPADPPPAAPSP